VGTLKIRQKILAPNLTGEAVIDQTARDAATAAQATADAAQASADANTVNVASNLAAIEAVQSDFDVVAGETLLGTYLGQPMYRQVFAVAAGPNVGATVNIAHGISSLTTLVSIQALLQGASGTWHFLPVIDTALATQQCVVRVDATNVILIAGAGGDYSTYTGHVILLYTKS
jgi:hypothetical protein